MKKLQPLPKISTKRTIFAIGSILLLSLGNILHFTFEFSILQKVGLPYFFIIFHMIGVPCGSFFAVKILNKWDNIIVFLSQFILFVFFLISLMIFLNPIFTPFGLFGAGFCIGTISGVNIIISNSVVPENMDPKYGGRWFGQGMAISSIFVIIYAVISLTENFFLIGTYFFLILITVIILASKIRNEIQIIAQENVNLNNFLKDKKNLSKLAIAFFHGFFIINTYYAAILIFDLYGFVQYLNSYVLILFIIIAIVSIPAGIIVDRIGRRFTIMIGLAIQALAFLILSFLNEFNVVLIIIFICFLGIGFSLLYGGFIRLQFELPKSTTVRDEYTIFMGFLGIGSAVGVILGEVIQFLIRTNPAYLTIVLLFVFICATIVVFQVDEILPSRSEKFIKPDNIDEEDLTLYKERKICLVCKGNAIGFEVYVCIECGVLYCLKCAKALSTLENQCWACNTPIDQSKPIKPLEQAKEDIKEDFMKEKL